MPRVWVAAQAVVLGLLAVTLAACGTAPQGSSIGEPGTNSASSAESGAAAAEKPAGESERAADPSSNGDLSGATGPVGPPESAEDAAAPDAAATAPSDSSTVRRAGPLTVHPSNPRYFTDGSGKAIYLTGSHTWMNFQDWGRSDPPATFDYGAYLDFLQHHNHNFIRLWVWENAKWTPAFPGDFYFAPLPYERTGPGQALDGKPKFDLTKFNQVYFDRLRTRIVEAGDRGIYVAVILFEGFSVETKRREGNPWPGHPFHRENNVNGIDGDGNGDGEGKEIHTLQNPEVTALQEAYVRKVIDTLNDLDNVLWEISNESHSGSIEWQYHMIDLIKSYESTKPKQHLVGMTGSGGRDAIDNAALVASSADWISPNPAGGYRDDPPPADGAQVVVNDTDHLGWQYLRRGGAEVQRAWVWKSFLRGLHPIFMDPYLEVWEGRNNPSGQTPDPFWDPIRQSMGQTLAYATRLSLDTMTPRSDLASTGYCLANPAESGAEYLVYLPTGGAVTVDLSASPGELVVEWFDPKTGDVFDGGTTAGGAKQGFTAPFNGDAVLYLRDAGGQD